MIKAIIHRAINNFESKYKYNSDYMREILTTSVPLVLKINQFSKFSAYRKKSPLEVLYVTKIAALKVSDCGPCLQLVVNFALRDKVNASLLEIALRHPEQLTLELKLAYDFAWAVASNHESHVELSEKFEKTFGKATLAECSVAIATAQVYPTIKRGLRLAKSCQVVRVTVP